MFSFGVAYLETTSNLAKRKKKHFLARKRRVFQIQHGYLDSTHYLGHCSFSAFLVGILKGSGKMLLCWIFGAAAVAVE